MSIKLELKKSFVNVRMWECESVRTNTSVTMSMSIPNGVKIDFWSVFFAHFVSFCAIFFFGVFVNHKWRNIYRYLCETFYVRIVHAVKKKCMNFSCFRSVKTRLWLWSTNTDSRVCSDDGIVVSAQIHFSSASSSSFSSHVSFHVSYLH